MTDNEMIAILLGILTPAFTGVAEVLQSYQPTQQGVPVSPAIFFVKIGDYRYGHVRRDDTWDDVQEKMIHTESVVIETTFQVSGLATQNPKDVTLPTASDLVNKAATVMQSSATLGTLKQNDLGILRITQVRNPYIVNDKQRFEASPSFDFTLTRTEITVSETPVATTYEAAIYPV